MTEAEYKEIERQLAIAKKHEEASLNRIRNKKHVIPPVNRS